MSDERVEYTNIGSLCCTPETNIVSSVNSTSIKKINNILKREYIYELVSAGS